MRINPAVVIGAVLVVVVLVVFSCSTSKSGAAPALTQEQLAEKITTLETDLKKEIAEAKSQSLILFVVGIGLGALGFLFVQHQIKRVRLEFGRRTHTVPPRAGDGGSAGSTVVSKKEQPSVKKQPAAKKKAAPPKDSPG